ENVRLAYEGLEKRLEDFFAHEERLRLHLEDGYLFANGVRLRAERHAQDALYWVIERFAESGVASLSFERGVKAVELRKFVPVFDRVEWTDGGPRPPLAKLLADD